MIDAWLGAVRRAIEHGFEGQAGITREPVHLGPIGMADQEVVAEAFEGQLWCGSEIARHGGFQAVGWPGWKNVLATIPSGHAADS